MKKKILLLMGIFPIILLQAQVGINTKTPLGELHIDSKGDTNGATNTTDDIIIDSNGNVGIGTTTPSYRLEIISQATENFIRIDDGTNFTTRKILVSDDNGVARWIDRTDAIYNGIDNLAGLTANAIVKYSGYKLTLTKGTWMIAYSLVWNISFGSISTDVNYLNTLFSTSNTTLASTIIPGSQLITNIPNKLSAAYTHITTIYNVTADSQDIYFWAYFNGPGSITLAQAYNPNPAASSCILEAYKW